MPHTAVVSLCGLWACAAGTGVLALVTMGLVFSSWGKSRISPEVEGPMHTFWHILSYHGNTLIFMLAGVLIALVSSKNRK